MNIDLVKIPIREVVEEYVNNDEEGVVGYKKRLNIRPKYQREFVYNEKDSRAVINTIDHKFPLNVMYWVISEGSYEIYKDANGVDRLRADDNAKFELLDGQQRTISFCEYITQLVSYGIVDENNNPIYFRNRTDEEKAKFKDYDLMVYICSGTDKEKLDWFSVINIAGKPLTVQELKNAIYSGKWVVEAKKYFSKTGCPASQVADKYHNTTVNRQELLELALKWIADRDKRNGIDNASISDYMARHQNDNDANDLWLYFNNVITWAKAIFPYNKKLKMDSIDWGILYNKYKNSIPSDYMAKYNILVEYEPEIGNPKGIFEAVLSDNLKFINPRAFDKKDMHRKYSEQSGNCPYCHNHFEESQMHGDHIRPWSKGGKTEYSNLQMLCAECNIKKSNYDATYSPYNTSTSYEDFDLASWNSQN